MEYYKAKRGNIFFIPLYLPSGVKENIKDYTKHIFDPSLKYAYGRLIQVDKSGGDLVEIFNYIGPIPSTVNIIIESGLLFDPVHVSMGFSKNRWRFIFEDVNYDSEKDSKYNEISFLLGDDDNPKLWKGGKQTIITKREATRYKPWIVYPSSKLEELVKSKIPT